jgi:Domain of unknown function (DUF4390)
MVIPRITTVILALALVFAALSPVRAEEEKSGAVVDEVVFSKNDRAVLVGFRIRNLASEQLIKTLESGLPVRFVYEVRFVRKAGYLTSGVLSDIKFERVLEKDNLKNLYRITEMDVGTDIADFAVAIDRLGRVDDLPVAAHSELIPEKRYQVEIQVKLEEFRLPFHIHRILPFFSAWDVTTPWKTVRLPPEFIGRP